MGCEPCLLRAALALAVDHVNCQSELLPEQVHDIPAWMLALVEVAAAAQQLDRLRHGCTSNSLLLLSLVLMNLTIRLHPLVHCTFLARSFQQSCLRCECLDVHRALSPAL